MSDNEFALFNAFLSKSRRYVEFGCGGSTVVASRTVQRSVTSIDSSREFLQKVAAACLASPIQPKLIYADIGPVGNWGRPVDMSHRDNWPRYQDDLWKIEGTREADFYFVDGRFRVACFARTVLHCPYDAVIAMHDFTSRPVYHVIREISREIAQAEDMSVFLPDKTKLEQAINILNTHRFVVD